MTLEIISFDNQGKAEGFFKEILNRYVSGETALVEDSIHLAALFKWHLSYQSKVVPGVDYFEVMPEKFGWQCFCAVLKERTKEGFSHTRCVTQREG